MEPEPFNYFNYYTEIEEHFQVARGTGLFLLSPLDWALIETWKDSGVPLEAVLRGIDRAFEKWHAKKSKTHQVNSIAYCSQAVMEEAKRIDTPRESKVVEAPFDATELERHFRENASRLPEGFEEVRTSLNALAMESGAWIDKLEELEQRLSSLEDKMVAIARSRQSEEQLLSVRRQLEGQLKPYRGKMSAAELMMIEKKFLDQRLLEDSGLPRLSLFYLG
jgi:predicted RNase H-like nuclease (RuvC/YqgF family)